MSSARAAAGPRARWRPLALPVLVAALVLMMGGCGGHASSPPTAEASYGGLPSFLPSAGVPDRELTGDVARPALTAEGDSVLVKLTSGSVRVTVTGPEVPGEGLPYQPESTTCTWTVSISGGTVPVAVRAADFTAIDHLGKVYLPRFVVGQPQPPGVLPAGQATTFELRAVMPTGEGLMRWAPQGHVVASWDFEVEND